MGSRTLTPDGADTYNAIVGASSMTVAAPVSNTGGNLRRVYWPAGQSARGDGTVYATWTARTADSVQEGLAHHITNTRAVTVTKNVWAEVYWVFNVHTWDGTTFVQIAQFDMIDVMFVAGGGYRPLPWRVASRMVGPVLTFKIWFPTMVPPMTEPSWTDPVYTRSTTVPDGWLSPGNVGWYAGHLLPGGSVQYTSLSVP